MPQVQLTEKERDRLVAEAERTQQAQEEAFAARNVEYARVQREAQTARLNARIAEAEAAVADLRAASETLSKHPPEVLEGFGEATLRDPDARPTLARLPMKRENVRVVVALLSASVKAGEAAIVRLRSDLEAVPKE
jgi:hypothetical protein